MRNLSVKLSIACISFAEEPFLQFLEIVRERTFFAQFLQHNIPWQFFQNTKPEVVSAHAIQHYTRSRKLGGFLQGAVVDRAFSSYIFTVFAVDEYSEALQQKIIKSRNIDKDILCKPSPQYVA